MLTLCVFFFFFFSSRRRHTRFDCDWSSDVCSSDLWVRNQLVGTGKARELYFTTDIVDAREAREIGRASCRGKSVDLGGRRIIKKKKKRRREGGDEIERNDNHKIRYHNTDARGTAHV